MGRAWFSQADAGLYFTIILRPGRTVPWLTLAVGLALRGALAAIIGDPLRIDIRWPNDVLIDGLKSGGILVIGDGDSVLIGIGVNVNQHEFPDELAHIATSVRIAIGAADQRSELREDLFVTIVNGVDDYLKLPAEEIRRQFEAVSSYAHGLHVEIEDTGRQGITAGLDPDGFLLLRTADGKIERIVAGGVRPVPKDGSATIPIPVTKKQGAPMALKETFTTEEWVKIRDTPNVVALAMAMAGASGLFGTIGELFTAAKAVYGGLTSSDELIQAVAAKEEMEASREGVKQAAGDSASAKENLRIAALAGVQHAKAILEAKAPQHCAAYCAWVGEIAQKVAESSTEGGFLGFGGERVSEGERMLLSELKGVL
jgi:BirA family biotin operon repressor/biotin-[acetyl-CoA-carboxylase] ligase